jgi:tetratricopeptide (TPR) repeat protein
VLSPAALLVGLERRLDTLTQGPRDAHQRQQTLRNTLAWSYDLLTVREQRLFRQLSVFVGGFTFKAIEAISQTLGDEIATLFEEVNSLLDKSLLQQRPPGEEKQDDLRLSMLETIREYGQEMLIKQGEDEATRDAHARYYLRLAEEAEPHLRGAEQRQWLMRLEQERENLRAALGFLIEQAQQQRDHEQTEQALRLGSALFWFWYLRSSAREGQAFLERALAASTGASPAVRAKALSAAAELAFYLEDRERMEAVCEESLALYQELGDAQGMAKVRYLLGTAAWWRSHFTQARMQLEEALLLFQRVGDSWGSANTLVRLGRVALDQGAWKEARTWCEQSLALFRALNDQQRSAHVLAILARVHFVSQDNPARAQALAEESLAIFGELKNRQWCAYVSTLLAEMLAQQGETVRAGLLAEENVAIHRELGDKASTAEVLFYAARVLASLGDFLEAGSLYKESLALARASDYAPIVAASLEGLGEVAVAEGKPAWAARLWGIAEALREAMGTSIPPVYRLGHERAMAKARAQLGNETFARAWAEGRGRSLEQGLAACDGWAHRAPLATEPGSG